MDIKLQITATGGIQMLHEDSVDLTEFGRVQMTRVSHIEWDEAYQNWVVISAKTGAILWSARTRAEALAWEKNHYSPGGAGWKEIA